MHEDRYIIIYEDREGITCLAQQQQQPNEWSK